MTIKKIKREMNKDKCYDLIENVYELFQDKNHWIQHALAKTEEGERCSPRDTFAVCWCLVGAFNHFLPLYDLGGEYAGLSSLLEEHIKKLGFYGGGESPLIVLNDREDLGYHAVMKVLEATLQQRGRKET